MIAGQDNISQVSEQVGQVGHIHPHMVYCVLSFMVTPCHFEQNPSKISCDLLARDIFSVGIHTTAKYAKYSKL